MIGRGGGRLGKAQRVWTLKGNHKNRKWILWLTEAVPEDSRCSQTEKQTQMLVQWTVEREGCQDARESV